MSASHFMMRSQHSNKMQRTSQLYYAAKTQKEKLAKKKRDLTSQEDRMIKSTVFKNEQSKQIRAEGFTKEFDVKLGLIIASKVAAKEIEAAPAIPFKMLLDDSDLMQILEELSFVTP